MNQRTLKLFKRVATATKNRISVESLVARWQQASHSERGAARRQMQRFLLRTEELGASPTRLFDSWGTWGRRG